MNAAIAGLIGTALGASGGIAENLIKSYFDERKARRELMLKTAYDFWRSVYDEARAKSVQIDPFETFVFHTMKVLELTERSDLTNEKIRSALKEIRELSDGLDDDYAANKAARTGRKMAPPA
jgi:hypothetical protein